MDAKRLEEIRKLVNLGLEGSFAGEEGRELLAEVDRLRGLDWIPADKGQLPPINTPVLVTARVGYHRETGVITARIIHEFGEMIWVDSNGTRSYVHLSQMQQPMVLAWKPLPEPYRP